MRIALSSLLLISFLLLFANPVSAQDRWTAYVDGGSVKILDSAGELALEILPQIWGPEWKFTGVSGRLTAQGDGEPMIAKGTLQGKMGGTEVPITLQVAFAKTAPNTLQLQYSLQAEQETALTLAAIGFIPGERFEAGQAIVTTDGTTQKLALPVGRAGYGDRVSEIKLLDAQEIPLILALAPAKTVASDDAGRILLAEKTLAADATPSLSLTVTLPQPMSWYPTPDSIPAPANWEQWFTWKGTGNFGPDSAITLSDWLEKPAGKHGRIEAKKDTLIYNGQPIKLWGINICFASTAPPKDLAEKQAKMYADVGINTVRFHKYAGGSGWAGILNGESFTEFDPEKLDRFDYFFAKLKEQGIYVKFSPTFGTFTLGPKDEAKIPFWNEMGPMKRNRLTSPAGGAYLSEELRDLQIEQMTKLLAHRNPYTGLTYAEDPALVVVELLNEQSLLFFTTTRTLQNVPTLRKRAAQQFTNWLIEQYGSQEAVMERWGEQSLNAYAGEGIDGESFEKQSIVPYGNPWFFDPDQLSGSQAPYQERLFDTMLFYYKLQNDFYDAYTQALRKAGYEGEVVASNWQAGRAFSHFYNLHSDARIGMIDRHNYFGGTPPMIDQPGGGSLSSGMQQVADRPFMLSEWVHVFPTQYAFEGPAIIGAYGMGLQDWDVSYLFQNRDPGAYLNRLGADKWVFAQPEIMGIFPAISRQVLRRDVKPSEVTAKRSVHIPSLHDGKLGFDDQVEQGYDEKTFDSTTVPAKAMAAVRSVVSFDDEFQVTPPFDLSPYEEDNTIRSSTDQLAWTVGDSPKSGYFTMNTDGTKAVVGFAPEEPVKLGNVIITPKTEGAAIYLTASGSESNIDEADRLLLVTMARSMNTGMRYLEGRLLEKGKAPIKMEPVELSLKIEREGTPTLHILDHDGNRTGETIAISQDDVFEIDGAQTQTVYYELTY